MRQVAILWLSMLAVPVVAQGGSAQDGAAVFHRVEGLTAHLGRPDGPVLPQGTLTCAGCHGADGTGGTEGGASAAPPIGWVVLGTATPERPAYDSAALARLLRTGVTPSGRMISARMPRFQGENRQMADLFAHLRALDRAEQRGLDAGHVAVTLPTDPDLRPAALAAITAFNAEGGAFGRRIAESAPAFLDLDAILPRVLQRLAEAEDRRLTALMKADPGLRLAGAAATGSPDVPVRIIGTLDQIGPQIDGLLTQPGTQAIVIGPPPEAMAWAIDYRQTGRAAHAYTVIRAVLGLLRDHGRHPTRTLLSEDIKRLDLSQLVAVYRH